ncbi:MAG TPA: UbiX family flavin prenyltransferase [Burkholderiales bacterium]|jgi:4-hydroxy-3-polyprenylbenzoate decarboxylase|nr:UbiX family flavin prenyltransferase [Burkholderiales bacterium]
MKRLIVAITGASGVIYGIRALEVLRGVPGLESHLILTPSGARTIVEETAYTVDKVRKLAHHEYNYKDIGAAVSSGSFKTAGMLVAPCSVKSLSGIANCYNDELVVRAADVCLKERRRVVLLFRETPLHAGHIALMDQATRNGAIVMPPVPAFYSRPKTIDELVMQTVGRALDLFDIDAKVVKRWTESAPAVTAGKQRRSIK